MKKVIITIGILFLVLYASSWLYDYFAHPITIHIYHY